LAHCAIVEDQTKQNFAMSMKKQELKQPDRVQVALERVVEETSSNRGPILMGVGVLLVLGAVVSGIQYNSERKAANLNFQYQEAARTVFAAIQSSEEESQKKIAEAEAELDALESAVGNGDLAPFVAAKRVDLYMAQEKYLAAIGLLEATLKEQDMDPKIRNAFEYRLMKAYVAAYNIEAAISLARNSIENNEGPFSKLMQQEIDRIQGVGINQKLAAELKARETRKADIAPQ
jgi:hypothetical protein